MRTRAEVEADMELTRTLLFANDQDATTPEQHAEGDELFEHYRALAAEYALLPHVPHPRLPSERDGHAAPKPI